MFRKSLISSVLLLLLTAIAIHQKLIVVQSDDVPIYKELMQASLELRSHTALEREPVYQARQGVQKDIWDQNLHVCLKSDESYLTLKQKRDKVEAIEELQQIEGWSQEELTGKKGTLRAEKGTYRFPDNLFTAQTVYLTLYNHWLQTKTITFDFLHKKINSLAPFGYFEEKQLFGSSHKAQLSFTSKFQPSHMLAQGDVGINALYQGKNSFAFADAVTYEAETQELLLNAEASQRVLFWQEGLELSAPQVKIRDGIEGLGDVRFILNGDEKDQLEQILTKHL